MQPKTLIIIDKDQTTAVAETLDAALALASFGENVHLWFKDTGVNQLIPDSNNGTTAPAAIIEALEFYDIEQVFIAQSQTNLKLYRQQKFRITTQWIAPSETATFINSYTYVLRFN